MGHDVDEVGNGQEATSRRRLVAGVLGGGVVAAAAVARPSGTASAAPGQAVLQGLLNNAGSAGTTLNSASATPTISMRNTGAGAAALMVSNNANGFAGGTYAPNGSGVSAANYSTTSGLGSAITAVGGQNYGINAVTSSGERAGVYARNLETNPEQPCVAVHARAPIALYGYDVTEGEGWAVFAGGDVRVLGDLYIAGSVIPDPAAAPNATDKAGTVVVGEDPTPIAVGNGEEREWDYQLTAVGAPIPDLHVADVEPDGSFTIGGAPAGSKVSWRATRRLAVDMARTTGPSLARKRTLTSGGR